MWDLIFHIGLFRSRISDDYTCKVTLELNTYQNYDIESLKNVLQRHIRQVGRLGEYTVMDEDFSFSVFDGRVNLIWKFSFQHETFFKNKILNLENLTQISFKFSFIT